MLIALCSLVLAKALIRTLLMDSQKSEILKQATKILSQEQRSLDKKLIYFSVVDSIIDLIFCAAVIMIVALHFSSQ